MSNRYLRIGGHWMTILEWRPMLACIPYGFWAEFYNGTWYLICPEELDQ